MFYKNLLTLVIEKEKKKLLFSLNFLTLISPLILIVNLNVNIYMYIIYINVLL